MNKEKQAILKLLESERRYAETLLKTIAAEEAEIINAQNRKAKLENDLQSIKCRIRRNSELLVLEEGLPTNVSGLRNKIIARIERSARKDITVAKKEQLEAELKALKEEIVKICPHPLVLSYDGYGGSSCDEYSDRRYGFRRCIACGEHERSKFTRQDIYEILTEANSRLVKRDLRDLACNAEERKKPKNLEDEIWGDINVWLELFRKAAGSINLGVRPLKRKE